MSVATNDATSALAVHDFAPVLAWYIHYYIIIGVIIGINDEQWVANTEDQSD